MKKALVAVAIFFILACTMFTMVACDHNVYLPENNTWSVRDMYFNTFEEALDWLMGQISGRSRDLDLISSDISDDLTIHLMRNVGRDEEAKGISVPASFSGVLCIDFQGYEYWFSSKEEQFFNIEGGDRVDIINGKTIIPETTRSDTKAVKVNVNVVTIDDHLVDDRRANPQAVEVGPSGVLVIKSTSDNRTEGSLGGAFDIQAGGALKIDGGVVRIESIDNPTDSMAFEISGGNISSPHEIANYVEAAIEAGGNADNVQTDIIHDINDVWISIDPEKHYKTCNGCDNHFEESEHDFTEWIYDPVTLATNRQCRVCGRVESKAHQHVIEFHAAKEPTCTEPGNIAYYGCDICGLKFLDADGKEPVEDVVLTKPHTLTHTVAVAATCTEAGNIEYWTCEECHQHFADAACTAVVTNVELPATGHAWGEWTVITPATCTEAGLERRVCANDETHHEEQPIAALGHELTAHEAKAATCTEAGNTAYWECTRCGKYFSDAEAINIIEKDSWVIAALGHAWSEEWTTDITDHWHVCTTCGEIKDKAEHTLGEWVYNPETGKMDNECTVCHKDFHQDHIHNEFNLTYHPAVPHTCTTDGTEEYYSCNDCNKKFVSVGITFAEATDESLRDPAAHALVKVEAKDATCETAGNIEYWKCDVCGKLFNNSVATTELTVEDVAIAALGHDWGEWVVITPATCLVPGTERRTCANDPTHTQDRSIAATGHDFGEWETIKEATCTTAGLKQKVCSHDESHKDQEVIPATGHNLVKIDRVEATCETDGHEEYWICDNCDQKFADEDGETPIVNPAVIEKLGHDWGEWIVDVEATCTTAGSQHRICANDEEHVDEAVIDALGHDLKLVAEVPATCTETGVAAHYHCERCGLDFEDREGTTVVTDEDLIIPATDHDWGEWTVVVPATCTTDGLERRTCLNDAKHTEERPIEALGHDYGDWVTIIEPTCTTTGLKQKVCSHDGEHILQEVIPTLPHTKIAHEAIPATCTEDGQEAYWECSVCHKYFADEDCTEELEEGDWIIEATGHEHLTKTDAIAPTCTTPGQEAYWTCDECGQKFSDEAGENPIANPVVVPALGHDDPLTHVEVKAATCTETGNNEYWYCSRCNKYFADEDCTEELDYETEIVLPTNGSHTLTAHEAVEPTCTTDGNTAYWECTVCHKYFSDEACEHEIEANSWILPKHVVNHIEPTEATEETHGNIEYWYCTECEKFYADADCEEEKDEEDTIIHNWSEEWTSGTIDNAHYHWHVCTVCGAVDEETKALCTPIYQHDAEGHWQICEVCEAVLTDKEEHDWSGDIEFDEEKQLQYIECVCGARFYDELVEVIIGEVTATIGENAPSGNMLVTGPENGKYTIRYTETDDDLTMRCRVYVDGVWDGQYLEDENQDGIYEITPDEGSTYKVVLEVANATGMSIFEKIIGL
ncbi:MAG: hypothetical protein IKT95_01085 [Spirochaetales bacterium]|nr:hypothetical protein [Spirochaetales bacterium]